MKKKKERKSVEEMVQKPSGTYTAAGDKGTNHVARSASKSLIEKRKRDRLNANQKMSRQTGKSA